MLFVVMRRGDAHLICGQFALCGPFDGVLYFLGRGRREKLCDFLSFFLSEANLSRDPWSRFYAHHISCFSSRAFGPHPNATRCRGSIKFLETVCLSGAISHLESTQDLERPASSSTATLLSSFLKRAKEKGSQVLEESPNQG